MTKIEPKTLKGFRDFLPKEMQKRQYVIDILKKVFESYGFEPLETPALEYEEILLGKYGEEGDKLLYKFEDLGGRRVALRYDQTVPLARIAAQYQNELTFPFKRYQVQPVWRAESPQRGRYREFLQCDADIVGTDSVLSDAEIIILAIESMENLGFKNFKLVINDRNVFSNMVKRGVVEEKDIMFVVRTIDKIKKTGREAVLDEFIKKGNFNSEKATYILQAIESFSPTERISEVFSVLEKMGVEKSKYEFSPTLARGLDYYTGLIFEIEVDGYTAGSVGGGGRYDNLIGMFAGKQIPAVGFAFGFDRLIEAMEQLNLFPEDLGGKDVLVTVFSEELKDKSIEISKLLRTNNIKTELYLDENTKLDKQIKYADKKEIDYILIIGPEEAGENMVTVKNLKTREQKTIPESELINEIK